MASARQFVPGYFAAVCVGAMAMMFSGCASHGSKCSTATASANAPAAASKAPAVVLPTIRVDAGSDQGITDSKGVVWSADTGFDGGETQDRPDLKVTGTDTPQLYQTERYEMNSYSFKVPNGNYTLKLHFSEDYDGINSPDDRRFTYAVKDGAPADGKTIKEVKHFSPWQAAGAQFKAYIDSVPLTVTSGQLSITFTSEVENPQINAIEILPR